MLKSQCNTAEIRDLAGTVPQDARLELEELLAEPFGLGATNVMINKVIGPDVVTKFWTS